MPKQIILTDYYLSCWAKSLPLDVIYSWYFVVVVFFLMRSYTSTRLPLRMREKQWSYKRCFDNCWGMCFVVNKKSTVCSTAQLSVLCVTNFKVKCEPADWKASPHGIYFRHVPFNAFFCEKTKCRAHMPFKYDIDSVRFNSRGVIECCEFTSKMIIPSISDMPLFKLVLSR